MTEPAVDVSSYQGQVNWQVEKDAGVVLGIAKASEGTGWDDPTFNHNWSEMARVGMVRGAYHFGHPANDPAREVKHFLGRLSNLQPTDTLWLDIETNDGRGNVAEWAHAFMLDLSQSALNNKCGIYTGKWFIDGNGGPAAWAPLTAWGLWMSEYTATLNPTDCLPWSSCVLWQNTSSARMPGVHGVCDASIIMNGGYFSATHNGKPTQIGAQPMPQPGVVSKSTKSGNGYWCVDQDGGVFTYGDAQFFGSTGNVKLAKPIVGFDTTSNDDGYWLVAADGGVFSFGAAKFFGGEANIALVAPIVSITAMPDDQGYILFAADNSVFNFGSAKDLGHPGA